jgi:hypothetical protein
LKRGALVVFSAFACALARAQAPTPTPTPAPAAAEQPAEFFQEESKVRLDFRWDFLARYDRIDNLVIRPSIRRGRFEARPELDLVVSDRFRAGVRAVGDVGTDQNSDNARNFDNYRSNGASLDRWFVEGKPGPFDLIAGSFGMPLTSSDMLWDRDIQTPGAAALWETRGASSTLRLAAAGFYGPQREGDQTKIAVGQAVWRLGDPAGFSIETSASYWHFDPDHLKAVYLRQNYVRVKPDGSRGYVSDFHLGDLLVRARFPIGSVPMLVSVDGIKNFGAKGEADVDDEDWAFEANVTAGSVGTPGQVRGFYTFQHVERDALPGAYNTDDWWFHSWYRGHRFGLAVTIFPQWFVQGAAMFQQRLDRKTWINRFTVDLVKMF